MPESMAANGDRDGESGNVRRSPLDIHGECSRRSAELRADARLVDQREKFLL